MRRAIPRARTLLAAAVVAFAAVQLLPLGPRPNPPVQRERSFEQHLKLTPEVQAIMRKSCMDCHSNETRWPWYGRVAPVSWLLSRDVERGRKAMNLSEWSVGPGRRPEIGASYLAAACTDAKSGRMPRLPYTVVNRDAKLTPGELDTLCSWTRSEFVRLIQLKRRSTARE
jgi:hypothetical protein